MSRIPALVMFGCVSVSAAMVARQTSTQAVSVWGTVRDTAGKAVEGAVVSIRAVDQTFTTSVFTDESGEYVSPPITARRYRMWAQATGFQTARAELALDRPASQPFTLQTIADVSPQLTGTEWFDALPDRTPEDRRMKQVLRVDCSDCHSLAVVLQNRFDEAGWRTLIQAMSAAGHTGWRGKDAAARDPVTGLFSQVILHHRDDLARYLARVRGPASPALTLAPKPRPRGAAAMAVATQYDVPNGEKLNEMPWFTGDDWSEGPAVGTHGIVGPHDVTADLSGTVWVHEGRRSFETNRGMTKLDPQTGQMTAIGYLRNGRVGGGEQVIFHEATNTVWGAGGGGGAVRWDPATETAMAFASPPGFPNFVNSHDTDSKGRLWFNNYGGSSLFDPATKKWRFFQSSPAYDGFSYGMAADADDNGWWSAWDGDAIYKGDVKTGTVTHLLMRDPEYASRRALATKADLDYYDSIGSLHWGGLAANPVPFANAPRRMSADKRGNTVWVPNWAGQNVAEINIRSMAITYHRLPLNGMAYRVVVDAKRSVWAIIPMADVLLKYDPTSKAWTQYPLPLHGCGSRHLAVDNVRGEMWVPCDQASSVVRFQFRTAEQIRAHKAAAQAGRSVPLPSPVAAPATATSPGGGEVLKTYKRAYDMKLLLAPANLPGDVLKGRNVWLQRCAFCHDGLGTPTYDTLGPYLDGALVQARGDAAVRTKILKGSARMPGFEHGLRASQIDQVIAFLKTIGPDQKPTAEQLKGRTPELPAGDL